MDHYEIHVTVKCTDPILFSQACREIGVKPVLLHLQLTKESTIDDMMTSSRFHGTYRDCWSETMRIEAELRTRGLEVVRRKIETWPNHKVALLSESSRPDEMYFETHLQIRCNQTDIDELKEIAKRHSSHLSRNVFKMNEDGSQVVMMTLRSRSKHTEKRIGLVEELLPRFELGKIEDEFVVHDSNEKHDDKWLSQ